MKRTNAIFSLHKLATLCCLLSLLLCSAKLAEAQQRPLFWGDVFSTLTWPNQNHSDAISIPQIVHGFEPDEVIAIAAGGNINLAVKRDGTVWTRFVWEKTTSWGRVSGLTNIIKVATSHGHSLALRSDRTVWAWGGNRSGELGDGTTIDRSVPVQVSGLTGVVAIDAENGFSLAVKSDGTVWAWGNNEYGQLGIGSWDNDPHTSPVQVSGLTDVVAVAGGRHLLRPDLVNSAHAVALKRDGTVWEWGVREYVEVIYLKREEHLLPTQVSGLMDVVAIDAGGGYDGFSYSLAVKADGTVWEWDSFQAPSQESRLSDIVSVAAGDYHSLALRRDGTVFAWGSNIAGQLGIGIIGGLYPSRPPTQVKRLKEATAIAAGAQHSFALADPSSYWYLLWHNRTESRFHYWDMQGVSRNGNGDLYYGEIPAEWRIAATPDLNQDGFNDALWQNTQTGSVVYWLMQGTRRLTYGTIYKSIPLAWQVVAAADMNQDGKDDILLQNSQTGEVRCWLMGGGTNIAAQVVIAQTVPATWRIEAALDLNRDGNADLLWRNQETGDMSYWFMNGTLRRAYGTFAYRVPVAWRIETVVDIDGDDDEDLIWHNTATGEVAYWMLEGLTVPQYGTIYKGVDTRWTIGGKF